MGCNASNANKGKNVTKRPGQNNKAPNKATNLAKKTAGGAGPATKNAAKSSGAPADTLAKPQVTTTANVAAVKSDAKAEADKAKKEEPKKAVVSASDEDSEDDDSASESSDADENEDSSEQSSDLDSSEAK